MMNTKYGEILELFNPISLKQAEKVKLFRRIDIKYVFPKKHIAEILQLLIGNFDVLKVNKLLEQRYSSVYFDTKEFNSYYAHHRNELPRIKYRIRKYLDTNTLFAEKKTRNNKDITVKTREQIKNDFHNQVFDQLENNQLNLTEKLSVSYSRIALINQKNNERISIDFDLNVSNDIASRDLGELCILELKQGTMRKSRVMESLNSIDSLIQTSISKYCYACNTLYPELKSNLFKERNTIINRIVFETNKVQRT